MIHYGKTSLDLRGPAIWRHFQPYLCFGRIWWSLLGGIWLNHAMLDMSFFLFHRWPVEESGMQTSWHVRSLDFHIFHRWVCAVHPQELDFSHHTLESYPAARMPVTFFHKKNTELPFRSWNGNKISVNGNIKQARMQSSPPGLWTIFRIGNPQKPSFDIINLQLKGST